MDATRLILTCVCFIVVCSAEAKIGMVTNCPGHKSYKTGIDIHITWSPYDLKPNTEYIINGTVTVRTDLSEATESTKIWIPERDEPIYAFPDEKVNCKDSNIFKALQFLNVTCPIKKGFTKTVTNMKQLIEGTEAAITGNFIVEGYLKDKKGNELACLRTKFTIAN